MLKNILLGILSIGVIFLLVVFISTSIVFGAFDKSNDEEALRTHYNNKQEKFSELIKHFDSIVPDDKEIEIEFENNRELFRFGITAINTLQKSRSPIYLEWNLNIERDIPERLLDEIKWNRQTFASLKSKLDKAGCIQIESGNPTKIGFQRSGMGLYSYYIYDNSSSDEFLNQQKTRDDIHFFKNNIAWKYDGGALD